MRLAIPITKEVVDLLVLLSHVHESSEEILDWLNSPHPMLKGACPIDVVNIGQIAKVHALVVEEDVHEH